MDEEIIEEERSASIYKDTHEACDSRTDIWDKERIYSEICKLTSHTGGKIKWDKVAESCLSLLTTEQHKDIELAGWLCVAHFRREHGGYSTLSKALEIYCDILKQPNDDYLPNENIARQNAFKWLDLRLTPFLNASKPDGGEQPYIAKCLTLIEQLNNIASESIDHPPPLESIIGALTLKKCSENSDSDEQESETAPCNKTNINTSEKQPDIHFPPLQSPDSIFKHLIDIAGILWENDHTNPLSYRLLRIAKWEGLKNSPEHPPPKPNKSNIRKIEAIISSSSEPSLIVETCEEVFKIDGLFWLDLQRFIYQAMMQDNSFIKTAEVIASEVRQLCTKFPKLIDMKFQQEMPFADEDTKHWVKGLITSGLHEEQTRNNLIISSLYPDMSEAFNQVSEIAHEKGLKEALNFLQKKIDESSNQRTVFLLRFIAGKFCVQFGCDNEAKLILHDLFLDAESFRLEEWEPALFEELCLSLKDVCYKTNSSMNDEIQKALFRLNLKFVLPN
ncbi:MAG: type VI secretion system domain-containing protein [Desulfamplus sp.]|nr:type VI secretion system domain-containing protein [Desulfamplus sp.]